MKWDIPSTDFKSNILNHVFQIFLSNGCIITFVVSLHTGDVDRVVIDKSLVGKLSRENPSHGRLHFQINVSIIAHVVSKIDQEILIMYQVQNV